MEVNKTEGPICRIYIIMGEGTWKVYKHKRKYQRECWKANSVTGSSMQGVLDWVAKKTHFKEIAFVLRPESVCSRTRTWRDWLPSNIEFFSKF